MKTTKKVQEDKIAVKLSEEKKFNMVLQFVKRNVSDEKQVEPTIEDKEDFKALLEDMRSKAAERRLIPQILRDIIAKNK